MRIVVVRAVAVAATIRMLLPLAALALRIKVMRAEETRQIPPRAAVVVVVPVRWEPEEAQQQEAAARVCRLLLRDLRLRGLPEVGGLPIQEQLERRGPQETDLPTVVMALARMGQQRSGRAGLALLY
jgi:hypothetical protein